jgi:hypothetical protein
MTGLMTLVLPESADADPRFRAVGQLARVEADNVMVGYTFDLRTNDLRAETVPNASAGTEHRFTAYRLRSQAPKPVTMLPPTVILEAVDAMDRE